MDGPGHGAPMNRMPEQTLAATRVLSAAPQLRGYLEPLDKRKIATLSDGWRALTSTGTFAEPFYQPEWFAAFVESFARHRRALALTVWSDAQLRGIAPLQQSRSFFGGIPARAYRSLSGIHSCRYDVIHDDADSHHIVKLMWNTLQQDTSWDVLEAEDVPIGGAFCRLMEEARSSGYLLGVWPTRRTPVLALPPQGSDPLAHCPRQFKSIRSRLKSRVRQLQERGDVVFDVHTSEYEEPLRRFLLLEASGWKGAAKSAIASSLVTTRFYAEMAQALSKRGMLRMYSLWVGRDLAAMQLGVAMNGAYYSPKVAYEESFARYSPGQVLNQFVIGDLSSNGFRLYDFLGPCASWKMVWTASVREHQNCYIFRPTLRGKMLHSLTMNVAANLRKLHRKIYGDPQAVKLQGE
jgi:hypothetical protein